MGLDMYCHWTDGSTEIDSHTGKEELVKNQFQYWRKHNHMHDWMQRLFAKKTGITDPHEFNCVSVIITHEDAVQLLRDIIAGNMQCTQGFFFGSEYDVSECKEEDMDFAMECQKHILLGRTVMYSSWW